VIGRPLACERTATARVRVDGWSTIKRRNEKGMDLRRLSNKKREKGNEGRRKNKERTREWKR
jgi:hypothetical protein